MCRMHTGENPPVWVPRGGDHLSQCPLSSSSAGQHPCLWKEPARARSLLKPGKPRECLFSLLLDLPSAHRSNTFVETFSPWLSNEPNASTGCVKGLPSPHPSKQNFPCPEEPFQKHLRGVTPSQLLESRSRAPCPPARSGAGRGALAERRLPSPGSGAPAPPGPAGHGTTKNL